MRALRDRMPQEDSRNFKDEAEPQGTCARRADEARRVRRLRELRDDVSRLRNYGGEVGKDGDSGVPGPLPRSEAYEFKGSDEGQ